MAVTKFTTAKVQNQEGKLAVTDVAEEMQEVNVTVKITWRPPLLQLKIKENQSFTLGPPTSSLHRQNQSKISSYHILWFILCTFA